MAIYFVDFTNGNNTNDGLTPATAFADFYADVANATKNDTSTFWVRNTSSVVLTEAKALSFKHIVNWPTATGFDYANRPQAGIDAGWDSDDNSGNIDVMDFSFNFSIDFNVMSFSNFNFNSESVLDANPVIYVKTGELTFNNCQIQNKRTNSRQGCFIRHNVPAVYDELIECTFNDVEFNTTTSSLFSSVDNIEVRSTQTMNFNRCSGDLMSIKERYMTLSYKYIPGNKYNIIDSDFVFSGQMIGVSYREGYHHKFDEISIRNSKITAVRLMGFLDTSYRYGMPWLILEILNSEVTTSSELVYLYSPNYSTTALYRMRVNKFTILNSTISAGGYILSMYRGAKSYHYVECPIIIIGCDITASGVFFADSTQGFENIIYRGNLTRAITSHFAYLRDIIPSETSDIELQNTTVNGNFLDGLVKTEAKIRNTVISGELSISGTHGEFVEISDSDFGVINGSGEYEVSRCRVTQQGSLSVIPNASRVVIKNSEVLSTSSPFGVDGGNVTIVDSVVEVDTSIPIKGKYSIFNSNLNSIDNAYEARDRNVLKKISPVFRLGGAPGSIVATSPLSENAVTKIDEIRGLVAAGTTIAKAFIVSNRELNNPSDKITGTAYYTLNDGSAGYADLTAEADVTSQWDGVLQTHYAYEVKSGALPTTTIDFTKKIYIEIFIIGGKGDTKEYFADLNIVGE